MIRTPVRIRKPVSKQSILEGHCLKILRRFPDNHFTAVVTDPPYGLSKQPDMREVLQHWLAGDDYEHKSAGFMGKTWDSFVPSPKIWEEVMRVLKSGGHILSFSGTRTYDLMTTAMRLAGAEVRDKLDYHCEMSGYQSWVYGSGFPKSMNLSKALDKIGSEEAQKWEGYGTALKPAHEPVAVFTKEGNPLEAESTFKYQAKAAKKERNKGCKSLYWIDGVTPLSEADYMRLKQENEDRKDEEGFKPYLLSEGNVWPTVKPLELMRYLVRLVKMPEDNLILDPFCGSGSTLCACVLEGCDYIGIDMDRQALQIAEERTHYFKCLGEEGLK